jgi:hypothetical protein
VAKSTAPFKILEATIDDIHSAYNSGHLTCRQLVQMYLDRIEAFDKKGPAINAIITISSRALEDADRIDAAYKTSGPVGTLHGIPVVYQKSICVGSSGRRLLRRLRRKRVSKFCYGGCGTRGTGVDTQAIDVELNCWNADVGGACKP